MSAGCFSVGIDWNYWEKHTWRYEDQDNFVLPMFKDFKSEILEYRYIDNVRDVYSTEIYQKAMTYLHTEIARSILPPERWWGSQFRRSTDEPIPLSHLISIILYTDYTQLSTDFSSTFRSIHKYEPLLSIKKRHARYYWLSKGLKEMMNIYGQGNEPIGLLGDLKGPFYTGMSFVLNMTEFYIKLNGPTSTSKQIAVATRFGGERGMIIEFDNSTTNAAGFDVSWISRYGSQEDERYISDGCVPLLCHNLPHIFYIVYLWVNLVDILDA